MSHLLTLNAGSSTLKFGVFEPGSPDPVDRATGIVDRIGSEDGAVKLKAADGTVLADRTGITVADHHAAVDAVLTLVQESFPSAEIAAVGHRVVHGGPDLDQPQRLTREFVDQLRQYEPFAPLHQPHNLAGVIAAMDRFPKAVQVACFDTAFHRCHPWESDTYALPRAYYDKGVRRYGFHGLSYHYIAGHLAQEEPDLYAGRVVVAHLGNGASLCGMKGGKSVASTMGFSALDGLAMGTRTGQLDPGVLLYLMQQEGLSGDRIVKLLYKESGLLGLSGVSNDMRTLQASENPHAAQAVSYFATRIAREIGAMAADLGGVDALVFTAGIGENSSHTREAVCARLGFLGLSIDAVQNENRARDLSASPTGPRVLVIPTNEELVIARAAAAELIAA
ncbi:MAG: acetate/propionate family kinase [Pseudomonadota bacterium]